MEVPKKALVISNCQCLPISSWLTALSAETMFDFWGVHLIAPAEREIAITQFVTKAKKEYDLIICIPLTDDFLELSTARIHDTFGGIPLITISNIYFSGLHPDLTYVGGLAQRILGPLGDYHSRLALFGFLRGWTPVETAALFCGSVYRDIGYYDEYAVSMAEMKERDKAVDVPVSKDLEHLLRKAMCLFSVNHPSSTLLAPYCNEIVRYLEDRGLGRHSGLPIDPSLCADSLANNAIFPIYPEIATYHGVAQLGSYVFKALGTRINPMNLRAFLAGEFKAFSDVGAEALATTINAKQILAKFSDADFSSIRKIDRSQA
jgi:hypothetical protein